MGRNQLKHHLELSADMAQSHAALVELGWILAIAGGIFFVLLFLDNHGRARTYTDGFRSMRPSVLVRVPSVTH